MLRLTYVMTSVTTTVMAYMSFIIASIFILTFKFSETLRTLMTTILTALVIRTIRKKKSPKRQRMFRLR